jgi:hypothetical protein
VGHSEKHPRKASSISRSTEWRETYSCISAPTNSHVSGYFKPRWILAEGKDQVERNFSKPFKFALSTKDNESKDNEELLLLIKDLNQ